VAYTTTATAIFIAAVILIALLIALYRRYRVRRAAARCQRPIGVALNDARRGEIVRVAFNGVGETADKAWQDHD
jgi:hypothetical protein